MRRAVVLLMLGALGAPLASAATPGASGAVEQAPTMSPKEKVEFARSALEEMSGAVKTVEKLLEQAQKDKQQEVVECLSKKLTPMRTLVDITKDSSNTMQAALAANDSVHADGEFRKIAVALSKAREFLQEALTCGGSTAGDKAKSVATITQTVDDLVDGSGIEQGIDPIEDPAIPGSPF